MRGGFELPPPTARIAPILRRLSSAASSTRQRSPTSRATRSAARASAVGGSSQGGSFERSLARFCDSARITPVETAPRSAARPDAFSKSSETEDTEQPASAPLLLYRSKR